MAPHCAVRDAGPAAATALPSPAAPAAALSMPANLQRYFAGAAVRSMRCCPADSKCVRLIVGKCVAGVTCIAHCRSSVPAASAARDGPAGLAGESAFASPVALRRAAPAGSSEPHPPALNTRCRPASERGGTITQLAWRDGIYTSVRAEVGTAVRADAQSTVQSGECTATGCDHCWRHWS